MAEAVRYTLWGLNSRDHIMVVGCGGTGGFVAEGICRLIAGSERRLFLIDHDRVEERNIGRQNFFRSDIGRFKSKVLAERLAKRYNHRIEYSVKPIELVRLEERANLTIGCVDNTAARERLQWAGSRMMGGRYSYCRFNGWYIDAGNSEYSGQVLIGNAPLRECNRSFYPASGYCEKLPLPTIQQPALLAPGPKPVQRDCAQAVADNEQSPVINQMMASLVLTFVHKLITRSLTWMASYLDLETGAMTAVEANPQTVSRITGLTVRQLEYRPRKVRSS